MAGELPVPTVVNPLFVAGNNNKYLAQIQQAVGSHYEPRAFSDPYELLDVLYDTRPSALVIDSLLPGMTGIEFISRVRGLIGSDQLPIVFTIAAGRQDTIDEAHKFPGVVCLEKPYRRADLLKSIARQINVSVEAGWEKLKPVPREAMQKTLSAFSNIAEVLTAGEALDYKTVTQSCEPLIQAVEENEYKDILKGIREHHNYTYVHSMRVATLLSLFGSAIGMVGEGLMTLTTGGLLHDVGKMSIPYDILNKKGKLTAEEFIVMQDHVRYTGDFLDRNPDIPKGIEIIATQHHEKLDGTGYPRGFKGAEINQLARMACIIDVFSALTDERSYKAAMGPEQAFQIMEKMNGHLDQDLQNTFKGLLLDSTSD